MTTTDPSFRWAAATGYLQLNCRTHAYRYLDETLFNQQGSIIGNTGLNPQAWDVEPPDSMMNTVITYACGR